MDESETKSITRTLFAAVDDNAVSGQKARGRWKRVAECPAFGPSFIRLVPDWVVQNEVPGIPSIL